MNIAIIGRGEALYESAMLLLQAGHKIVCIVTAKAAPEYTKTEKDFEFLAKKLEARYLYTPKISSEQGLNFLLECGDLDIAISVNYINIISSAVIKQFKYGVLNAHGGDLPRYRGNACQAWAILNKEERIGLCIHKMMGGELDSGDIIAREYFALSIDTKVSELVNWMNLRIPLLFKEAVGLLDKNQMFVLEKQSSNSKDALRCYPRCTEDAAIDWRQSAEDILRLINASSEPYSGAFCQYEGEKITVWRASLVKDDEQYLAQAGQVSNISNDGVVVITGNGKILIKEITYKNQRISSNVIINSIRKRLASNNSANNQIIEEILIK